MFRSAKIPITCWGPLGWDCILELADNHGIILKRIPSQNCTWKSPSRTIFANISLTFWGPWGWGCRGSWQCPRRLYQHGTILKQILIKKCTWKSPQRSIFANISWTCWGPWGWSCRGSWGCPRWLRSTWDHKSHVIKSWHLFRYLLLAEVLEVGVVEVHEGVLEGSDQHGTILK